MSQAEKKYQKLNDLIKKLPAWTIRPLFFLIKFISHELGLPIPFLSIKPQDFGICLFYNQIEEPLIKSNAPILSIFRHNFSVTFNKPTKRAIVKDGKVVVSRGIYVGMQ